MIFDAETNVLTSYLCSLQVYIQEFGMRMRRLLGSPSTRKQKRRGSSKKALLSYLLCFFSTLNNIKTFEKFSIQRYATPPKPIFGPIDPFMVWPVSYDQSGMQNYRSVLANQNAQNPTGPMQDPVGFYRMQSVFFVRGLHMHFHSTVGNHCVSIESDRRDS